MIRFRGDRQLLVVIGAMLTLAGFMIAAPGIHATVRAEMSASRPTPNLRPGPPIIGGACIVLGMLGVAGGVKLRRYVRPVGVCPSCGYSRPDRSGFRTSLCPECGKPW